VGKNIPTSKQEEIKVYLKEVDGEDKVTILSPDREASNESN
jgi:pyrimidine operon attenuation protein/uracil phosphoribosyltransferase